MEQIKQTIRQMIEISDEEMDNFLKDCSTRKIKKKEVVNSVNQIPNEIYFINKGLLQMTCTDQAGVEHTIYFAMENQFVCDYSCFIQKVTSHYTLKAIENTEVVVLPRSAIEWGYKYLTQGDRLGRLIAEFYFIIQDSHITSRYIYSPKERYDMISEIFPNINSRAPQHMIASYLGITPIHLSRLKKEDYLKT